MGDYSNDVKSQKKIEQRNKTADFQLKQYTDKLTIERRRKSNDFDRERRIFEKRFLALRNTVKTLRRYSEQLEEQRDLDNGNIRRSSDPARSIKSAPPRKTELEVIEEPEPRPASTMAQQTDDKVFITQRAPSKRGKRSKIQTPTSLPKEEEDEEAETLNILPPEDDIDTWSMVARDLREIAGDDVITRVERNKANGPRNLKPTARTPRSRLFSVFLPSPRSARRRSPPRRPFTSIEGNSAVEFSYDDFTLKRPDTSKVVPKDINFIKQALARTKTPQLPFHARLGIGQQAKPPPRSTLAPPDPPHGLVTRLSAPPNGEKTRNAEVQFLDVSPRSARSRFSSTGGHSDAGSEYRSRSNTNSSSGSK